MSVGNVVRHPGGISQVGRFKVNVVRDLIREKNPNAQISVHPVAVEYENRDAIRELIAQADVVVCGTDSRPSKLLVNQLCIDAEATCVYGGAFRRAYGGQVLRVRPRKSPCHQCFVAAMPDEAADVEVSSSSDAEAIAYSDRPVAVEPGLSLDVLPIANLVAKLALLDLLAGTQSSLNPPARFRRALVPLAQPAGGRPQYASLPPLSESSDEMTIHRWYGIYFDRDDQCPVCGNFLSSIATNYGLDLA
jgi:molybdopterin/thiamine biosynthesis adenylyltransferase